MGFNLEFAIHLQREGGDADGVSMRVPARAVVFGDIDTAKLEAEAVIAQSGGLTGQLFETSHTSTWFENGRHVASFVAGKGWTAARPIYPLSLT